MPAAVVEPAWLLPPVLLVWELLPAVAPPPLPPAPEEPPVVVELLCALPPAPVEPVEPELPELDVEPQLLLP